MGQIAGGTEYNKARRDGDLLQNAQLFFGVNF